MIKTLRLLSQHLKYSVENTISWELCSSLLSSIPNWTTVLNSLHPEFVDLGEEIRLTEKGVRLSLLLFRQQREQLSKVVLSSVGKLTQWKYGKSVSVGDLLKRGDFSSEELTNILSFLDKKEDIFVDGEISLTFCGLSKSINYANRTDVKPNITAQWFQHQPARTFSKIAEAISRKCNKSSIMALVEDHVHDYVSALINRNGLRSRIENKKPIRPSQLGAWGVRYAISTFRAWAQDASVRSLRGALTEGERKEASFEEDPLGSKFIGTAAIGGSDFGHGIGSHGVVVFQDEEGLTQNEVEMVGGDMREEVEKQQIIDQAFGRITEIIEEYFPHKPFHAFAFREFVEGERFSRIARQCGQEYRNSNWVDEIREVLQDNLSQTYVPTLLSSGEVHEK